MKSDDGVGPFLGVSLQDQIVAWQRWQKSGQRPELHSAVRTFDISPPEGGMFHVLGRVSLNRKWEDQERIQCNVCRIEHKFISDGYVASYDDDGFWYVIGPVCGSDEHQTAVAGAIREHKNREAEKVAEGIVADTMNNYSKWREYYYKLRNAVEIVFEYHNRFRKIAPNSLRALSNIRKSGGALRVVARDAGFNADIGRYQPAVTKTVGRLAGGDFFQGNCLAMKFLRDAVPILELYFADDKTKDDLGEAIYNAIESGKLQKLQNMLSGGFDALHRAHEQYEIACAGLNEANFKVLAKWTANPRNEAGLHIEYAVVEGEVTVHFLDDRPPLEYRGITSDDGYSILQIRQSELQTIDFLRLELRLAAAPAA